MPTKKNRRRPAGQAAPRRAQPWQGRPAAPNPPLRYQSSGQRVEDSTLYDHPQPRRRDNTVAFPTGQTRPSSQQGGQRPRPQQGQHAARPRQPARDGWQRPAQARPVQTVPRRENRRRRRVTRKMLRRRRMMRRLAALFLVFCVAVVGIYLTVTMLFKINAIRVAGPDGVAVSEAGPYTAAEILEALDIQLEENIFSFDPGQKAAALEKAFPLLEQIEVRRVYPSTVVVRVTPAEPAYAMQTSGGWVLLSAGLKILAAQTTQPDLPVLYGGEPVSTTPGDQLAYAAEGETEAASGADSAASAASAPDGWLNALNTLVAALEERGLLEGVTRFEYADVEQIAFLYQDRISVLLGTLNELDYKLDYAEYMLLNRDGRGCAETDTGQLDCSHVRTDGTLQAIFAQGDPELPSGYIAPDPAAAPETDAVDGTEGTEGAAGTADAAPAETGDGTAAQTSEE